ncbi:hypothetical protein ONE63_005060 [Megalurothrips usitatus]|uniref:Uncharacterized protein n=1 Tax=Megalurothrips usitatus TaxID=439358 RepID=A0AAV7X5J4_9NEOP|nr:hypothetical protein ONE63_005060 [Megalurothrips usitatus]
MSDRDPGQPTDQLLSGLMKDLYDCAIANHGKMSRGWRFPQFLKELSTLLYLLTGKLTYVFLSTNLPIPSLTTVKSHLQSTRIIREGEFRIAELKTYLVSRNEPLKVYLSEDATRSISKVQYHSETNQVVGPVPPLDVNGCPIVGSFPATSSAVIAEYFTRQRSTCVYTIMAQPLGGSPPFCLAFFGTDNRFSSLDVMKRMEWSKEALEADGIEVIGNSSDGDCRCLKVMRVKTLLPNPKSPWKWFQANLNVKHFYFQDFVHLLVKLKSRLLTPSIILPLGPKLLATSGHLAELMAVVQRDQRELTPSFLDNKDKMNFKAADSISKKKVSDLLRSNVIESEGTATYLEMMREIFLALADSSLSPQQRIQMLWGWLFIPPHLA